MLVTRVCACYATRTLPPFPQTSEHWRWGCLSSVGCGGSVEAVVERLTRPGGEHHARVGLTYYTQYHLHRQLKKVGGGKGERVCGWVCLHLLHAGGGLG